MRRAIASLCRDQAGTPCDDNTPFSELVSSLGNKMSSDKENLTTANRALDDFRCALYGSEEGQVAEGSDAKTKSEGLTSKVQELKSKLESAEASNKSLQEKLSALQGSIVGTGEPGSGSSDDVSQIVEVVSQLRASNSEKDGELEKVRSACNDLNGVLSLSGAEPVDSIQEAKKRLEAQDAELTKLRGALDSIARASSGADESAAVSGNEESVAGDVCGRLQKLREELSEEQSKSSKLSDALNSASSSVLGSDTSSMSPEDVVKAISKKHEEQESELSSLRSALVDVNKHLDSSDLDVSNPSESGRLLCQKIDDLKSELSQKSNEISSLQESLNALERSVVGGEGDASSGDNNSPVSQIQERFVSLSSENAKNKSDLDRLCSALVSVEDHVVGKSDGAASSERRDVVVSNPEMVSGRIVKFGSISWMFI